MMSTRLKNRRASYTSSDSPEGRSRDSPHFSLDHATLMNSVSVDRKKSQKMPSFRDYKVENEYNLKHASSTVRSLK